MLAVHVEIYREICIRYTICTWSAANKKDGNRRSSEEDSSNIRTKLGVIHEKSIVSYRPHILKRSYFPDRFLT